MCMSGKRMTAGKARFEIFLMVLTGIRSVFFNIFMLGLGFILGFGFYKQCHKVFDRQDYQMFQDWVKSTKCIDQTSPTNRIPRTEKVDKDGKSDL